MMFRAFLKDSLIYIVPAFISRGLSFFLVPIYTRILNPADYGSFDLLTVFGSIVNMVVALEISQGLARFYAKECDFERKISYASTAFLFTLACYSIFAVLSLLFSRYLASFIMGQVGLETAFQLGIAYIWINGLFYLVQNQFRWELRSREYSIVSILMSLTTAGASVLFAYTLHWGMDGLLFGMAIGSLAGTSLGLWWLKNSFCFRFDGGCLREMLDFSTPLVFSGLAIWISLYIDRIMINQMLSVGAVGLYGIGYRVASIAGLVMVGFQGALTPLVFAYHQDPDAPWQLAKIFRFFVLFATSAFLFLTLFAPDIIKLFATDQFFGGVVVVKYLAPAIFLANMYIFAPGISIANKTHLLIWINGCGALLNAVLAYILIPQLGIAGAGIATLVGSFVVFFANMTISQTLYPVPHRWDSIFAVLFAAVGLGWCVPLLGGGDCVRWIMNFFVFGIFLVICVLVGLIKVNELQGFLSLMSRQFLPRRF